MAPYVVFLDRFPVSQINDFYTQGGNEGGLVGFLLLMKSINFPCVFLVFLRTISKYFESH